MTLVAQVLVVAVVAVVAVVTVATVAVVPVAGVGWSRITRIRGGGNTQQPEIEITSNVRVAHVAEGRTIRVRVREGAAEVEGGGIVLGRGGKIVSDFDDMIDVTGAYDMYILIISRY